MRSRLPGDLQFISPYALFFAALIVSPANANDTSYHTFNCYEEYTGKRIHIVIEDTGRRLRAFPGGHSASMEGDLFTWFDGESRFMVNAELGLRFDGVGHPLICADDPSILESVLSHTDGSD